MKKKRFLDVERQVRRQGRAWFFVGLPILGILGASLLPLSPMLRTGLIGMVLFWFQISLMMGVF